MGRVQAAQKENVLDALGQIARAFRQSAGESLTVIRQHDTPLAEATTPSLDALKSYSAARKLAFSASFNSAVLKALASLHRRQPAASVSLLQTTLPLELATPGTSFFRFFGGLYPAYLRGQCYLLLGDGDKAADEFQKVIDHPGVVYADPIGALAHLELGRACALSGNKAKAKAAYQAFLSLWRDADPDITLYKQAKAECSRLR